MKKLNNKGFAISTIIYGISIMGILLIAIIMAEMASIRSNTRLLSKSIEEDLNSYSKTAILFEPSGSPPAEQEYIVPEGQDGWYRIELWGSKGSRGYGAYTSGIIELEEGDVLYFYVGTSGSGKETDVRVSGGAYDDAGSYVTRIMVAGGGGSDTNADGGTLFGYTPNMKSTGGYIKSGGSNRDYSLLPTTEEGNTTNGTLVGFSSKYDDAKGPTQPTGAIPSPLGSNGGGDGYGPGTASNQGGASFIAGYAGCHGIKDGSLYTTTKNGVTYYHPGCKFSGKDYNFLNGVMLAGVNNGAGKARIEKIAVKDEKTPTLNKINKNLDKVKSIRDCVASDSAVKNWTRISAISAGQELITSALPASSTSAKSGYVCVTYDFSSNKKLDEIAVWHKAGVDYPNHTIEVYNGSSWISLKSASSSSKLSETETETGYRISAYQYDSTKAFPLKGNYYILPVLSENKVISAADSAAADANAIGINYLTGKAAQKWSIECITDKKLNPGYDASNRSTCIYKITELDRYKSLQIYADENIVGNKITTGKFNSYTRNEPQLWKITPVGNGTYVIKTIAPSNDVSGNSGNILPQTNPTVDGYNELIIGKNNDSTQRFKFIAIDYSSN